MAEDEEEKEEEEGEYDRARSSIYTLFIQQCNRALVPFNSILKRHGQSARLQQKVPNKERKSTSSLKIIAIFSKLYKGKEQQQKYLRVNIVNGQIEW